MEDATSGGRRCEARNVCSSALLVGESQDAGEHCCNAWNLLLLVHDRVVGSV